jgi:hypothetical protein
MNACCRSLIALSLAVSFSPVFAADAPKPVDDQYMAIAASRTRADLAIRKVRTLAEENEGKWRMIAAATDAAHAQILESLRKATEDEQRRTEELRNPAVIDELNQRRTTIEQDWQRYAAVDRPAIDTSYRNAIGALGAVAQVFATLTNIEATWKDAKVDLSALQAGYDAVAKRAEDLKAQAEKATSDLISNQKQWESVAKAAISTQPVK